MSETWLYLSVLFGAFGLAFFVYGKKQRAVVPLLCGLALMIFPYFVASTLLLLAMGVALIATPYFLRA